MKFLLDENISHKVAKALTEILGECKHVKEYKLNRTKDGIVWNFAAGMGFTILTKDRDFVELAGSSEPQAKVVVIAIGNCTTQVLTEFVAANRDAISEFVENPTSTCLIIESRSD